MNLPNFSNLMNVGQMRYIQSHFEQPEYCNPDALVGSFLSFPHLWSAIIRGRLFRPHLRSKPFYHYILARTKYYDELFLNAVYAPVSCIINIGCGTDTRAYRFGHILQQKKIAVMECDQPQAIAAKQKVARSLWSTEHIEYFPLDLNDGSWPDFARRLDEKSQAPALVMLEGVSPYICKESFEAFLRLLAGKLHPRSLLAYDFKIDGAAEGFGRSTRVQTPFRLRAERKEVEAYHESLGFKLQHMETGPELTARLLPGRPLLFDEDCLLLLGLCNRSSP
jgi:methyltransferase (TIGR00027 family)